MSVTIGEPRSNDTEQTLISEIVDEQMEFWRRTGARVTDVAAALGAPPDWSVIRSFITRWQEADFLVRGRSRWRIAASERRKEMSGAMRYWRPHSRHHQEPGLR